MKNNIISFDEFPYNTGKIFKRSEDDHKAILKGASIEVPWNGKRITLKKVKQTEYFDNLVTKTCAKQKKLKVSEVPEAYTIQQFDFRIIPLFKILE